MGQKKVWAIVAAVVAVILIAVGIFVWKKSSDEDVMGNLSAREEEIKITAMYVPYGEDENQYIMVDQNTGAVFTVTMPREIYDVKGKKIKPENLKKGNILSIYGNGIMLDSYPGQYPQVTKIQVEEEGRPSDADQYQTLVDGIYREPDPAQPPSLNLEYRTDSAAISSITSEGGYEWNYVDKEGKSNSVIADASHILTWDDIIDCRLEEPTDITLRFSEKPDRIEVKRWTNDMRKSPGDDSDLPDGEDVSAEMNSGDYILKGVEPGFVYLITAHWDTSYREYGFLTE
ncbi:hypothetical protein [Novisyntrophococcus fermenticellae]|uniref:hypothetical protein n=1 Tax=Novisyntrophococcus fermenticellae TaxID=2068655 RepID=UPI001E4AC9D2|nr:hypothetical protein [Novisyntrophococcus fermenticellae]